MGERRELWPLVAEEAILAMAGEAAWLDALVARRVAEVVEQDALLVVAAGEGEEGIADDRDVAVHEGCRGPGGELDRRAALDASHPEEGHVPVRVDEEHVCHLHPGLGARGELLVLEVDLGAEEGLERGLEPDALGEEAGDVAVGHHQIRADQQGRAGVGRRDALAVDAAGGADGVAQELAIFLEAGPAALGGLVGVVGDVERRAEVLEDDGLEAFELVLGGRPAAHGLVEAVDRRADQLLRGAGGLEIPLLLRVRVGEGLEVVAGHGTKEICDELCAIGHVNPPRGAASDVVGPMGHHQAWMCQVKRSAAEAGGVMA